VTGMKRKSSANTDTSGAHGAAEPKTDGLGGMDGSKANAAATQGQVVQLLLEALLGRLVAAAALALVACWCKLCSHLSLELVVHYQALVLRHLTHAMAMAEAAAVQYQQHQLSRL
jgi:hypothetical protein